MTSLKQHTEYKFRCNIQLDLPVQNSVKNIPASFREWLADILGRSEFLGCAVEHFEGPSQNLAGMFLHNSV